MNRLLRVVALAAVTGGVAAAQPPAGAGKERTLLEQEFFLGEPPQAVVAPKLPPRTPVFPKVSPSILGEVRSWLVSAAVGRLGVAPLVRPEVW